MATKSTVVTTVAPQLRERIARGRLAPNTKIRLQDLSDEFGISVSSAREALLLLSAEGFVIGEDQRGFRVASTSGANLAEVTLLRSQFEPFALRKAIESGNREWEERLVAIFYRLTRIEKQDGYVPFLDEWEAAHREFHLCLISGCNLPMLYQFCSSLHDMSDRYRRIYLTNDLPPQRNVAQEHAAIVDAVLARDADLACRLLTEHSERTGKTAMERLTALSAQQQQHARTADEAEAASS
jgi:DNA-binding GntR family transcriptional regulator